MSSRPVAQLVVHPSEGEYYRVDLGERLTIGRKAGNDLQLLDRLVSKRHAVIEVRDGRYVLIDCNSRNGTRLNHQVVTQPRPLEHGDIITVGATNLVFIDANAVSDLTNPQQSATDAIGVTREEATNFEPEVVHDTTEQFLPAAAIESPALLRREYERLRVAYELQRQIALEMDLDTVLDRICEYLFESLPVERVAVLLGENEALRVAHERHRPAAGGHPTDNPPISRTLLHKVVVDRKAVLASNAQLDTRFSASRSIVMQGLRSVMAVPLVARERVVGVLYLENPMMAGAFSERDLSLVQGIASQAALAIQNALLVRQVEHEAIIRQQLSRLMSPNLVERILRGELTVERGAVARKVTVLFADIRGFTALAARLAAEDVVQLLNEYFEMAIDVVFRWQGTFDKFLGDGFMAVWGAPVSTGEDVSRALAAAVEIQRGVLRLNEERAARGAPTVALGIGMDTGEVVAGYVGALATVSYTVVGNHVNRAARLCEIAPGGRIFVTRETVRAAGGAATSRFAGRFRLKGLGPIEVYEVTACEARVPSTAETTPT